MKKTVSSILFSLAMIGFAQAQTTITNASFPQANNITQTSTTFTIPGTVTITGAGATAQTWDFSALSTEVYNEDTILAASTGAAFADFPNTEIITPLIGGLGGSAYTDVTTTEVTRVGGGLEFFGFSFVAPYDDPHTIQTAPLTYGNLSNDDFAIRFAEHVDSIPGLSDMIDSLTGGTISPDSMRLSVSGTRTSHADAYGTLSLYNTNYDVIRHKVTEYTNLGVEAYIEFFPGVGTWQDVTSFIGGALPFPTADTSIHYDFLAEGFIQPIVQLNMDPTDIAIESANFRGQSPVSTTAIENKGQLNIYPNPAKEIVNIETRDLPVSTYVVEVSDLLGRQLIRETKNSGGVTSLNLAALPTGNYICTIRDEKGQLLHSQKLTVE